MRDNHQDYGENLHPFRDRLFVLLQYLLPHHLLSWLMYLITRSQWKPLKDRIIRAVIRLYGVNMEEAQRPHPAHYPSFNAFFTRALRAAARPLAPNPDALLCPADGTLSQAGSIRDGRIFQAKGHSYSLQELLGERSSWWDRFHDGCFATIYLSPRDYHRVHIPLGGELKRMIHVPGRLFSVNPVTTRMVPRLFARNERVVCLFESDIGPMAIILVGAIFVASIDTVWAGTVAPAYRRVHRVDYDRSPDPVALRRGQEMGRFNMGSTVILLFGPDAVNWRESLTPGTPLRMGESLGRIATRTDRSKTA